MYNFYTLVPENTVLEYQRLEAFPLAAAIGVERVSRLERLRRFT